MIPTLTAALWRIGEDGAPEFGGWAGMVVSHPRRMLRTRLEWRAPAEGPPKTRMRLAELCRRLEGD
jgi:hypothetical protein